MATRELDLVWASDGDRLIFLGEREAQQRVELWTALRTSRTWGELRRRIDRAHWKEILEDIRCNQRMDLGALKAEAKERLVTVDFLVEEKYELDFGFPPRADAPFDSNDVPGFEHGEYPTWPTCTMSGWVPEDIQDNFGLPVQQCPGWDYDGLDLPDEKWAEVVRAFEFHGYRCRQDQALVHAACFGPEEAEAEAETSDPGPEPGTRESLESLGFEVVDPDRGGIVICGIGRERSLGDRPASSPSASSQSQSQSETVRKRAR